MCCSGYWCFHPLTANGSGMPKPPTADFKSIRYDISEDDLYSKHSHITDTLLPAKTRLLSNAFIPIRSLGESKAV